MQISPQPIDTLAGMWRRFVPNRIRSSSFGKAAEAEWALHKRQLFPFVAPFESLRIRWLRQQYWKYSVGNWPPRTVAIEINSLCNRRCSYCPVATQPRPKGKLANDDFARILNALAARGYRGELTPSFFGEPLLDNRIFDLMDMARRKLPNCTIRLHTNADFLDIPAFSRLLDIGVNHFMISQHDEQPSPNILSLLDFKARHPKIAARMTIRRLDSRDLTNRGGLVSEGVSPRSISGCDWVRDAMITYEGKMVLCCNDFFESVTFGNVLKNEFWTVWQNSLTERGALYAGYFNRDICLRCTGKLPSQSPSSRV